MTSLATESPGCRRVSRPVKPATTAIFGPLVERLIRTRRRLLLIGMKWSFLHTTLQSNLKIGGCFPVTLRYWQRDRLHLRIDRQSMFAVLSIRGR